MNCHCDRSVGICGGDTSGSGGWQGEWHQLLPGVLRSLKYLPAMFDVTSFVPPARVTPQTPPLPLRILVESDYAEMQHNQF